MHAILDGLHIEQFAAEDARVQLMQSIDQDHWWLEVHWGGRHVKIRFSSDAPVSARVEFDSWRDLQKPERENGGDDEGA